MSMVSYILPRRLLLHRLWLVAVVLLLGAIGPRGATAQTRIDSVSPTVSTAKASSSTADSSSPVTEPPLLYREVFVPRTSLPEFVSGYLPMPRDEYQRLLRRTPRPNAEEGIFAEAVFFARLDGDHLVDGTARLSRRRTSSPETNPSEDRGRGPSTQSVQLQTNLAWSDPQWRDRRSGTPAVLGTSPAGRTELLDQANFRELQIRWSASGRRSGSRIDFALELPQALVHRLELTLPAAAELQASHGMVESTPDSMRDIRHWTIELGGRRQVQLAITNSNAQANASANTEQQVRQRATYQLRAEGLLLRTQIDVSNRESWQRFVTLQVDRPLTVTDITADGKPCQWSILSDSEGTITVELPKSLGAERRSYALQVDAIGQYPWQQLFSVPRIRLLHARWVAESHRIQTLDQLQVTDLQTENCFCQKIEPSLAPGEIFTVWMETAEGQVSLYVEPLTSQVEKTVGIISQLSSGRVESTASIQLVGRSGAIFETELQMLPDWILDSVSVVDDGVSPLSSAATGAIRRWELNDQQLWVEFREPIPVDLPVVIELAAHRELALQEERVAGDALVPFGMGDTSLDETFLMIRPARNFQIHLARSSSMDWQLVEQLPEWLQRTWQDRESDFVMRVDQSLRDLRAGVREAATPFEVDIQTRVRVRRSSVSQSTLLSVDPRSGQLSELEILCSQPLPPQVTWLLNGEPIPANKQTNDGSRIQLLLSPAQQKPFLLELDFELSGPDTSWKVPLVDVRNAATRTGGVAVMGLGGAAVRIDSDQDLLPMPVGAVDGWDMESRTLESRSVNKIDKWAEANLRSDADDLSGTGVDSTDAAVKTELRPQIQAAYRYSDAMPGAPQLDVTSIQSPLHRPGFVWRCDIRSFYGREGQPLHRADLMLQSLGARDIELKLPLGYRLSSMQLNGKVVRPIVTTDGRLAISLPTDTPFPSLTLWYTQAARSIHLIDWLKPPVPESSMPMIQKTWQVWLPPGFGVYAQAEEIAGESWRSRLFGPFAGGRGEALLAEKNAWQMTRWFFGPPEGDLLGQRFLSLLGRGFDRPELPDVTRIEPIWAEAWQPAPSDKMRFSSETWGDRLLRIRADVRRQRPEFEILVDRVELRRLGIFPDTPLPSPEPIDSSFGKQQVGIDRLNQAGMAVVRDGNRLILTSNVEVQRLAGGEDMVDGVATLAVSRDGLPARYQPLDDWALERFRTLWRPTPESLEESIHLSGWSSVRHDISSAGRPLKVFHRNSVVAVQSAVFFLFVVLGWRMRVRRRSFFPLVLATCLVAALTMPRPGAGMAAAGAWGLISATLLAVVRQRGSKEATVDRARPRIFRGSTATATATASLLGWLSLLGSGELTGQDITGARGGPSMAETEPNVEQVLIPTVDNQPAGNVVYVTESLYEALYADEQTAVADWLIAAARYRAVWPRRSDRTPFAMQVEFQVRTQRPNVAFFLPQFDRGANVDFSSIRVNRVATRFATVAGKPAVVLSRAGEYRVSFDVLPILTQRFGRRQLSFAIPPVGDAKLELTLPRGVRDVAVPSAKGQVTLDSKQRRLQADLGLADHLDLRVFEGGDLQDFQEGIEQLVVISVAPGQANIDSYFRFAGAAFPLRIGIESAWAEVAKQVAATSSQLEWDEATSELSVGVVGGEVKCSLPIPLPAAVGSFPLPQLKVRDVPIRQRWLAVSTRSDLAASIDSVALTPVSRSQFLEAWQRPDLTPNLLALSDSGEPLRIDVRRARNEIAWINETNFLVKSGTTSFRTNGELDPGNIELNTARFLIPENQRVESVSAYRDGITRPVRWHVHEGELSLFFLDQPRRTVQLTIEGQLKNGGEPRQWLDCLTPVSSDYSTSTIRIFRAPSVEVDVRENDSFTVLSPDSSGVSRGGETERLVRLGAWFNDPVTAGEPKPIEIHVNPKATRPAAKLYTGLQRVEEGWKAQIEAKFDVSADKMDVVRFEVPATLTSMPIECDLPMRVQTAPQTDRRIISIRPRPLDPTSGSGKATENKATQNTVPIGQPLTIRFVASIAVPQQEGVSLPMVKLLDTRVTERLVQLPVRGESDESSANESKYDWATVGLTPDREQANLYHAARDDYGAKLRRVDATKSVPRVHLVRSFVNWLSPERFVGLAIYELQPAQMRNCEFELPTGGELVQVTIDQQRTFATPMMSPAGTDTTGDAAVTPHRWQVQLDASPWPQRVQLVFRGTPQTDSGGRTLFPIPRLLDETGKPIDVGYEYWSLTAPGEAGRARVHRPQRTIDSPRDISIALLRASLDLLDDAQLLLRESPKEDITAWFVPWASRARPLYDQLVQVTQVAHADDDPAQQEIRQLLADYAISIGNLGMTSVFESVEPDRGPLDVEEVWLESQWQSGPELHVVMTGDAEQTFPTLQVDFPELSGEGGRTRYWLAVAIAGIAIGMPRTWMWYRLKRWMANYPQLAGLVVSIGWWLFLSPPWIGLFFAALILAVWTYGSLLPLWRSGTSWRSVDALKSASSLMDRVRRFQS